MKVVIVLPTYQEKENLQVLIPKIKENTLSLNHTFEILIADDKSPDGTADWIREQMKTDTSLHLTLGNKIGLGAAYIRGIKYALEKLSPEVIIEMDADLSHNPKDLPKLIREIEKGSDFVIGSRYLKGGQIPADWSIFRKLNSRWGNRFARRIAGLKGINDCTSGFRAIKAELLRKIDFDLLTAYGYSFQMRLLYESKKFGAKIKEVPIVFTERKKGKTKLGFWDIVEFVLVSFKIRMDLGKQAVASQSKGVL